LPIWGSPIDEFSIISGESCRQSVSVVSDRSWGGVGWFGIVGVGSWAASGSQFVKLVSIFSFFELSINFCFTLQAGHPPNQ
jgi:hypothetical protein